MQKVGEMTEQEWLESDDSQVMLAFLQEAGKLSERKARLLAVACCRMAWHLLTDMRSREAVEVVERHVDEPMTNERLEATASAAGAAFRNAISPACRDAHAPRTPRCAAARAAFRCILRTDSSESAAATSWYAGDAMARDMMQQGGDLLTARRRIHGSHARLLQDVLGPLPFRDVRLDPAVLAWNDAAVVRIATSIYEQRVLPAGTFEPGKMAILADALEEAGCHDPEVLWHCRDEGLVHVRGCWVLDLVGRKEVTA